MGCGRTRRTPTRQALQAPPSHVGPPWARKRSHAWSVLCRTRMPVGPRPYKFIGFGGIHGPKPYKFIGFGDIHGPKPYKFIGFGDIHGPKPYKNHASAVTTKAIFGTSPESAPELCAESPLVSRLPATREVLETKTTLPSHTDFFFVKHVVFSFGGF